MSFRARRPLTAAERYVQEGEVEWGRIPDVEKRFGIRRSKLYELIGCGAIRSSCLRRKGAKTGEAVILKESSHEVCDEQIAAPGPNEVGHEATP